jgi:hypothetical protein
MSVEAVVARIAELQGALAPRAAAPRTVAAVTGTPQTNFSALLGAAGASPTAAAGAPPAVTTPTAPGAGGAGARVLAAVQGEVGQAEQPPGSNDSPRIAQYRSATAGAPGPGPWCAYFTSWAAREAGVPLGDRGQGFGRVDDVYAWAQGAGKAIPAGSGPPQPGDLIVWDEHIGVVESVLPDGRVQTVEGNSSDQVARRTYGPDGGGAIGFVRLG